VTRIGVKNGYWISLAYSLSGFQQEKFGDSFIAEPA
jgi:hypothetical protein